MEERRMPYRRGLERKRARSLRQLADQFVAWTVDVGFSPYTASIREQALRQFTDWCGGQGVTSPARLSAALLEEYQLYIGRYRTAKGTLLMATTQVTRINPVRAFCKWLTRQRLVSSDPATTLSMPRLPRRLPSYVPSETEIERVLAAPDVTTPLGLRDRAAMELLYSSAIRRLEMTTLKVTDLRIDRGEVWVRDGKGGKDRVVPVGGRAAHWLRRYLAESRNQLVNNKSGGTLFLTDLGEPFVKNRLGDLVKRYLKRGGIRARGSCHMFRHACATHMLEHGADIRFIQEMLGHSDLSTTQIYTRVSIAKLKEVHARYHPAASDSATNS
jgi:integrase/recombinase XerD